MTNDDSHFVNLLAAEAAEKSRNELVAGNPGLPPRRPRFRPAAPVQNVARPSPSVALTDAERAVEEALWFEPHRDWRNDHINTLPSIMGHWQHRFEHQQKYHEFRKALERRGLASASEPVVWASPEKWSPARLPWE